MATLMAYSIGEDAGDGSFDAPCTATASTIFCQELREKLASKRAEAEELRSRTQRSKLRVRQLRLCLTALGVDPSFVPRFIESGGSCSSGIAEPAQRREMRSLLQFLVECVDLTQQVVFECGGREGTVTVGGRRVLLQRMAAWRLSVNEGSLAAAAADDPARALKLSVPLDLQAEIASMLLAARRKGSIGEMDVQRIAEAWEMVGAEVVSAAVGHPEPAIFLVHRVTTQAMVVAQWPAVEFAHGHLTAPACGARCAFDPRAHFSRLASSAPSTARLTTQAATGTAAGRGPVVTGDRVEVEYEGRWFEGVLRWATSESAHVQCDADAPGVITVAPLSSVRPVTQPKQAEQAQQDSQLKDQRAEAAAFSTVDPGEESQRMVHRRRFPGLARARSFG